MTGLKAFQAVAAALEPDEGRAARPEWVGAALTLIVRE